MKKRFIVLLIIVALIFGSGGFVVGLRVMEDTEAKLLSLFSEDVKEVRQGKMAGAMVAMVGNETLSEEWEEVCSDVMRVIAEWEND